MKYNTSRSKLLMPEYGRNVQRMVEYLMTIEDKDKRLRNATAIVELMSTLTPHLKTIEDYKHKLWDHLYQMTDFKLEVEGPYPPPLREEVLKKPEVLPYPRANQRNRHVGKNLTQLIEKAIAEPDPEKRQGFTQIIGYYMKLAYTNWHKEPVHDDMIKNELAALSNGILKYESGGYKVHFDNRNHKHGKNNRNRNFNNNGGGGYGKNKKYKNKSK